MNTEIESISETIPEGFKQLDRGGPFFRLLGQAYGKQLGDGRLVIGLRLGPQHMNSNGVAHGGMLVTLADSALGIAVVNASGGGRMATVNLSSDFMEASRVGDWLEAHVEIQRMGDAGVRHLLSAGGRTSGSARQRSIHPV